MIAIAKFIVAITGFMVCSLNCVKRDRKQKIVILQIQEFFETLYSKYAQDYDYYPFGMQMPGRKFTQSGSSYRYGFNGQEKDNEVKGEGNSYGAQYWEYDSRIMRRWNIDPMNKTWESPYACFSNNPILLADPYGLTATPPT